MKNSIGITTLIFLLLTIIDMRFGSDCTGWNRFYFIKENALPMFFCFVLAKSVYSIFEILILYSGVVFFGERILFNIFFFEYSNSDVFSIIFAISIIAMLLTSYSIKKWMN